MIDEPQGFERLKNLVDEVFIDLVLVLFCTLLMALRWNGEGRWLIFSVIGSALISGVMSALVLGMIDALPDALRGLGTIACTFGGPATVARWQGKSVGEIADELIDLRSKMRGERRGGE